MFTATYLSITKNNFSVTISKQTKIAIDRRCIALQFPIILSATDVTQIAGNALSSCWGSLKCSPRPPSCKGRGGLFAGEWSLKGNAQLQLLFMSAACFTDHTGVYHNHQPWHISHMQNGQHTMIFSRYVFTFFGSGLTALFWWQPIKS